ncbi:hypothetical protein L1887_27957 [Cichorium endivia]|nr:hypothetical protein L1887_27957 [Cichorium endivia]
MVRKSYKQNKLIEITYSDMKDKIIPSSFTAFTKIAYQCLKRDREQRPLMNEIVTTLEAALRYQLYGLQTQTEELHNESLVEQMAQEESEELEFEGQVTVNEHSMKQSEEMLTQNTREREELQDESLVERVAREEREILDAQVESIRNERITRFRNTVGNPPNSS